MRTLPPNQRHLLRNPERGVDATARRLLTIDRLGTSRRDSQEPPGKIKKLLEIAQLVQSVLTIVGIIAAGLWFYFQSEFSLRANITHSITHKKIHTNFTWIHATVEITNVGKRRLTLGRGLVKLYQIIPLDIKIHDKIKEGISLVAQNTLMIDWPVLENRDLTINSNIYPGETEKVYYEFIIPSFIETVELYTFFSEISNDKHTPGWHRVTTYDLTRR